MSRWQFGYLTDYYYYCKYLRDEFGVTYIGFKADRPEIRLDGVTLKYIPLKGCLISRFIRLTVRFVREGRKNYDLLLLEYFPGCSLLRLLTAGTRCILDIRTGSVAKSKIKRKAADLFMKFESYFFRHITVISQGLGDKLRLPKRKTHILPLGAESIDTSPKKFDELHLLYVGTLNGRRIEDTIDGFEMFYKEFSDKIQTSYTIIGDGRNDELQMLRNLVREKGLVDVVRLPGFIHRSKLRQYFERCEVGISYVPINEIYDCQPPTKTFEYVFAGMPVIATATSESRRVINRTNGILIRDNPKSFYEALKELCFRREEFHSEKIKRSCLGYSWESIVKRNLIPYLAKNCLAGV